MSARLIMVDVHKFVITPLDPIGVPVGMVMNWVMTITCVLVCTVSQYTITVHLYNQILENVLVVLTTVQHCV